MRKSQAKFLDKLLTTILPITIILGIIAGVVGVFAGSAEIDTSFDIGTPVGFNRQVSVIKIQNDGKILVGGLFSTYQGIPANKLIRLNADGTKDTSFIVGEGFGNTYNAVQPYDIEVQSDGKILVGGRFDKYQNISVNGIIRLNTDGSIDSTFNPGDTFNHSVDSIAIQNDGKILVGGASINGITVSNKFVRLNTDGSTDVSKYLIDGLDGSGYPKGVKDIAIQSDGKTIIGGNFTSYDGNAVNNIVRLTSDMNIDPSFSFGNGFDNTVRTIAIQSDGKIIVGGAFSNYQGSAANKIIRLYSNGSNDNSFTIGNGFDNTVRAIVIQSDGKIIVGGAFSNYQGSAANKIIRLDSDGSNDNSFINLPFLNTYINSIQIQNDGKIVVGCIDGTYNGVDTNYISRLNATGSIDASFNIGRGFNGAVRAIIQSGNKIIVGGEFTSYNGISVNKIVAINIDGTIDTGFDMGIGFNERVKGLAFQSDGKILVGGDFSSYNGIYANRLIRLNSNGSRDMSFNSGLNGYHHSIYSVVVQSDGKILIGGLFKDGATNKEGVIRLNSNGSRDISFNLGSQFSSMTTIQSIAIQNDGKIIVGGNFTTFNGENINGVIRLNSDGSRDNSFDVGGGITPAGVYAIAIQSDGKIVVGGLFDNYQGVSTKNIVRINPDGSRDTSFNVGNGFDYIVYTINLSNSGQILAGGQFTKYQDTFINRIILLNSDGTLDTSFNVGDGFNRDLYTILVNKITGNFLIGGNFTSYNGVAAGYIASLYGDANVVKLPNSTDTTTINSAFIDQGYTENNGTLIGSAPISLELTDGNIPITLNILNENINLSILGDTQVQNKNTNNYNGTISVPVNNSINSVNNESVITAVTVGSNSNVITLAGGGAIISIPLSGQIIGNRINIYYSTDNGVSWYFETTTQVIDKNGEPYIEFTTDHFGDFAITEIPPDTTAPIITLNGNSDMNIDLGTVYSDAGATALDETDGDISANIIISGSIDTNITGSYTITYNVSDDAGNQAKEVTRTISVVDPSLTKALNSENLVSLYNCPTDATYCDLSNQGITSIAPDTFISHTALNILYLNNNVLTSINSGAFNGISSLQYLYLYNNQLTNLNSVMFSQLSNLTYLDLGYNQIKKITSNVFSGLNAIQTLYLYGNGITSIEPNAFSSLSNLTELDLGYNEITSINSDIFSGLSALQGLYLYSNQLTTFPSDTFDNLPALTELDLDYNQISSLPNGAFSKLSLLNYLYLYNNRITSLQNGVFNGLTGLQYLYINNNPISSVQTGVFKSIPQVAYLAIYNTCDNKRISFGEYMCTDSQYTTQESCLAAGWCGNGVSLNKNTCEAAGFCQDGISIDKTTCENNGSSWNQIYYRYANNSWYTNGVTAEMDSNYCGVINSEDPNNFSQALSNKGYVNNGGISGLGSDYYFGNFAIRFAPGFVNTIIDLLSTLGNITSSPTQPIGLGKSPEKFSYTISSLHNQFLENTVMKSVNPNEYIQTYYSAPVEVQYDIGTEVLSGGQEFIGILHNPELFNTINVPGLTGVVALTRFGALTHSVEFSKPITIRIPAIGKISGDKVNIYSSEKENIYISAGPAWLFEKEGIVADIDGTPYVQFTTTHASWYAVTSTSNQGSNNNSGGSSSGGGAGGDGAGGGGAGAFSHGNNSGNIVPGKPIPENLTHGAADTTGASIEGSTFSPDINEAYLWAYSLGITTIPTIQKANIEGSVYRSHMAKMLTEYAIKVLKKVPNTGANCTFTDMKNQSQEMQTYAVKTCQLGLMGLKSNGTPNARFHPTDPVTRAQFGTILSRLLYGNTYNVSASEGIFRYSKHLQALKRAGIMTKIKYPMMKELRGNIFIMLMRASKK